MTGCIKIKILIGGFLFLILIGLGFFIMDIKKDNQPQPIIISTEETDNSFIKPEENILPEAPQEKLPSQVLLTVPYINEAPSNNWTGPWKNACEEASIAMVEMYYQGKTQVSIKEAEAYMQTLFDKQDQLYGTNHDADTARMLEIINTATSFKAIIKEKPTLEDIKKELLTSHPVITPLYGYDLKNPNIPFLRSGSYYHMLVVIGYDDKTNEFIVNDTGDIKQGASHRYDYELFLNSIHDFDFSTKKANGPARVIFTSSR